jgi:hypothetical protein
MQLLKSGISRNNTNILIFLKMAIINGAVTTGAKGSIKGLTFTQNFGRTIMKSKASVVSNPNTAAQANQRNRMKLLQTIAQFCKYSADHGFKQFAILMYSFNFFIRENLKNGAITAVDRVATFVPAMFVISKGSIGTTNIASNVCPADSRVVTITWDNSVLPINASLGDVAIIVVHNATQNTFAEISTVVLRSAATANVTMPVNNLEDDVMHFYLGFTSANFKKASNSVHATRAI